MKKRLVVFLTGMLCLSCVTNLANKNNMSEAEPQNALLPKELPADSTQDNLQGLVNMYFDQTFSSNTLLATL